MRRRVLYNIGAHYKINYVYYHINFCLSYDNNGPKFAEDYEDDILTGLPEI